MSTDIYIFNSTCEMEVANGSKTYDPKARFVDFSNELSFLPIVFSKSHDIIISDNTPSVEFIKIINKTPLELPNFSTIQDIKTDSLYLKPWGWSPLMHQKLSKLKPFCSSVFKNSPNWEWNKEQKCLYSRATALNILKDILNTENKILIPFHEIPIICKTQYEVEEIVKLGKKLILKSPWSSSGRGQQTVQPNQLSQTTKQWLKGILRTQGFVMVEYFREKVLDTSLHFEVTNSGITFHGFNAFKTDEKGQYIGNYINPQNHSEITKHLSVLKNEITQNNLIEIIIQALQRSIFPKYYRGVIGIDVLIYKNENGEIKINPCMEINCRHTMGTVALAIEKHTNKNSKGMFFVTKNKDNKLYNFHLEQLLNNPIKVHNNKIISGYIPLTNININSKHHAWVEIID